MPVRVKIYPSDPRSEVLVFDDVEHVDEDNVILNEGDAVDYLSLISSGTYGKPPLITKNDKAGESEALAREGKVVLYVNTGAVLAMRVERT